MQEITSRARYLFSEHGWSDEDIDRAVKESSYIIDNRDYCIIGTLGPDGVHWLYPVSSGNKWCLSLWKEVKRIILAEDNVVIPMNKNMEKVKRTAQRYNGYLLDNLYLFGDELKGIKEVPGITHLGVR